MKFLFRKIGSYAIDYAITMFFVALFTFCSNVFMLDSASHSKAYLMLVCAFITVIYLTTYVPTKNNGQTIGQKALKLRVVNKNDKDRTYFQSFIRECVVKISCAPFFVIFSVVYYLFYGVIKRNWEVELPHDFILKTEVIDVNQEIQMKLKKKKARKKTNKNK